jgi:membrane protein
MRKLRSRIWAVLLGAFRGYTRDGCSIMAAATAFYALLSLVPLTLLAVSIFGHFLGAEEAHRKVVSLVQAAVPGSSQQLVSAIRVIASRESRWFVNLVGLFGLLWSGLSLVSNLSVFLTRAWGGQPAGRAFLGRRLIALAAIAAAGVLFLVSVVVTSLMSSFKQHPETLGALARLLAELNPPIGWVVYLAIEVAIFFCLYRVLPAAGVSSRAALVGAVAGALLWHLSHSLFGMLVESSSRYGHVYGPLAGVVIFMLWVYYSATILFFCAEMGAAYQRR